MLPRKDSTSSYNSTLPKRKSASSLPRTQMQLDGKSAYRSMSSSSGHNDVFLPNSPTMKDLESLRSANLKQINGRLIAYVDKVRNLQRATDMIDSISKNKESDSIHEVKTYYETEMADWKATYEEILSQLNKAKVEIGNLKHDNKHLTGSLSEKAAMLREREGLMTSLEAENNELLSKLNILQSEKGRALESEQLISKDVSKLRIDLDGAKKGLEKEKMKNGELEAKLRALEQEKLFKIQVLEKELTEERKKTSIDLSALDMQMKNDYEVRLKAEIKKLRKIYEEHMEKCKLEFGSNHSRKLMELEELLKREKSERGSASYELQAITAKLGDLKKKIGDLEKEKIQMSGRILELEQSLSEERAAFRAQIMDKDKEIMRLINLQKEAAARIEELEQVNRELDLEIEIYRSIIDEELERLQKLATAEGYSFIKRRDSSASSSSDDEGKHKTQDYVDGRKSSRQTSTTTRVTRTAVSRF